MRYDYRCEKCEKEFEVEVVATNRLEGRRSVSPKCPHCKSRKVKKLIRPAGIVFKGSGFYKTDKEK